MVRDRLPMPRRWIRMEHQNNQHKRADKPVSPSLPSGYC